MSIMTQRLGSHTTHIPLQQSCRLQKCRSSMIPTQRCSTSRRWQWMRTHQRAEVLLGAWWIQHLFLLLWGKIILQTLHALISRIDLQATTSYVAFVIKAEPTFFLDVCIPRLRCICTAVSSRLNKSSNQGEPIWGRTTICRERRVALTGLMQTQPLFFSVYSAAGAESAKISACGSG